MKIKFYRIICLLLTSTGVAWGQQQDSVDYHDLTVEELMNYLQGETFWETLPIDLNDVERIEVGGGIRFDKFTYPDKVLTSASLSAEKTCWVKNQLNMSTATPHPPWCWVA